MSFLGNALSFEGFHGKKLLGEIGDDPSRLISGVDPASTGLWNSILGTHNKALVDQMGGATSDDYNQAQNAGIDTTAGRDLQDLAHVVAAYYGAAGLGGAMGAGGDAGTTGADMGDAIDAGGGWNPAGDPALAGDDIDAGGGWNPSSSGSNGNLQKWGKLLNQAFQQQQRQSQAQLQAQARSSLAPSMSQSGMFPSTSTLKGGQTINPN